VTVVSGEDVVGRVGKFVDKMNEDARRPFLLYIEEEFMLFQDKQGKQAWQKLLARNPAT